MEDKLIKPVRASREAKPTNKRPVVKLKPPMQPTNQTTHPILKNGNANKQTGFNDTQKSLISRSRSSGGLAAQKSTPVIEPPPEVLHRADFPQGSDGEVQFIRAQLSINQKEVIAMCKQYDKLMMKNMRIAGWVDKDPNNSEFGLIKKAIAIITNLEELVQHSAS